MEIKVLNKECSYYQSGHICDLCGGVFLNDQGTHITLLSYDEENNPRNDSNKKYVCVKCVEHIIFKTTDVWLKGFIIRRERDVKKKNYAFSFSSLKKSYMKAREDFPAFIPPELQVYKPKWNISEGTREGFKRTLVLDADGNVYDKDNNIIYNEENEVNIEYFSDVKECVFNNMVRYSEVSLPKRNAQMFITHVCEEPSDFNDLTSFIVAVFKYEFPWMEEEPKVDKFFK